MYHSCLVTPVGKTVHVDIKFINAPSDYNILLGHIYTYAMLVVTSVVFFKYCFPHDGKIITIDQLNYYKPTFVTSPKSIISSMSDKQPTTPSTSVSPRAYKDSLFGAFPSPPPILEPTSMSVCML